MPLRRTRPPHGTTGLWAEDTLEAGVSGMAPTWRGARAAESARLEIVCPARDRGFKSHSLRQMGFTHAEPIQRSSATVVHGSASPLVARTRACGRFGPGAEGFLREPV